MKGWARIMAETAGFITREEVYDIVRDSIGIPNQNQLPPNPPCDAQVPTVEWLMKQQAEKAQYNAVGLPHPPPPFSGFLAPPPTAAVISWEERQYQLNHYVEVLLESNKIRHDEALMKEIRAFIRQKRDEAATLLDEIG